MSDWQDMLEEGEEAATALEIIQERTGLEWPRVEATGNGTILVDGVAVEATVDAAWEFLGLAGDTLDEKRGE